ncbi:hypothetical protein IE81DRAFT_335595 [Ceraceosorus guamensis]|uniref:DUF453-domain-containing protein n=1 Tax=Ceraceosorus guamensis TaxID=1522189 RepID=A0A316VQ76_9BASI|nr:hypothetical protein IE81DRAFT_335595 [Ceraceosorus guamensis]PWN39480.1 hypothetical protein IE81DRAFT_335595 [Ceraceosorus guamensis]
MIPHAGTSRGLIFSPSSLARFDAPTRDRIICAASSPDPDMRQISGLGGGASSLSKCAIVSAPADDWSKLARIAGHPFPGVAWSENFEMSMHAERGWDCVYRFGQVPINGTQIDWGSTCGNLVAAVADYHLSSAIGSSQISASLPPSSQVEAGDTTSAVLRILAHDTGKVVKARVPVYWEEEIERWMPCTEGEASIAGVPGTGPAIVIESPLESDVLPTGRPVDSIKIDESETKVTVTDTGLPTIFVDARDLRIPLDQLVDHPSVLETDGELMRRLEKIRYEASQLSASLSSKFSPPAPKICLVHPKAAYKTTGGQSIEASEMDVLIRALSNGQVHRTVPATTLSAATAALCYDDSVISRAFRASGGQISPSSSQATRTASPPSTSTSLHSPDIISLTVGQPAGLSTASAKRSASRSNQKRSEPTAIVMTRTARRIMQGNILGWHNFMPPTPRQHLCETPFEEEGADGNDASDGQDAQAEPKTEQKRELQMRRWFGSSVSPERGDLDLEVREEDGVSKIA